MFSDSGSFVKFSFLFSFSFLVVVSCLFADRLHITQQTNFTQRVGIFFLLFRSFFSFYAVLEKPKSHTTRVNADTRDNDKNNDNDDCD